MCAPIAIAALTFAVGAAQAVTGYMGQMAAADAQNEHYRQNAEAANEAARQDYKYQGIRMQQEREAAALEKAEVQRDVREAQATARTAAGQAGVTGFSVNNLLAEFTQRGAAFNQRVDRQTDMTITQIQASQQGTRAAAESRINSVRRAPQPSFFDAGIRILGSGLQAGRTYLSYT